MSIVVPLIAVHLPLLCCQLSTYSYLEPVLEVLHAVYSCLIPASIMMSTYSYLEPVLEVLHAESIVVPLIAVHLPLL